MRFLTSFVGLPEGLVGAALYVVGAAVFSFVFRTDGEWSKRSFFAAYCKDRCLPDATG